MISVHERRFNTLCPLRPFFGLLDLLWCERLPRFTLPKRIAWLKILRKRNIRPRLFRYNHIEDCVEDSDEKSEVGRIAENRFRWSVSRHCGVWLGASTFQSSLGRETCDEKLPVAETPAMFKNASV